jgi:glycine cleavage system H protein
VYAPVAGEVVEVNAALGARSELINTDPYGEGYMLKIKVSDVAAVSDLLDAAAYAGSIG